MRQSYIAVYRSTNGKPLIGGVLRGRSSRWGEKSDATSYLQAVMENNGSHCKGEIITSSQPPEIFRHCPDPSKPPQAINGRCFSCGKILTKQDALNFSKGEGPHE